MRIFSSKTKTNSRRNSLSRTRYILILALAVCGFVLLAYARGGVGTVASTLFHPLLSIKTWVLESLGGVPLYLRAQQTLISKIQLLENELKEKEDDTVTFKQLQAENNALNELFGLAEHSRIIARVLARPNQTPYDTLLIDRGIADGIVEGAVVYIKENLAVGVIVHAYTQSSLVQLVSSPGVRATAYIFGPNIFTESEGMGGGVLRVTVPQGIPFAVGDVVVLPAGGTGAYGEVVSIEAVESSPEQYGYVTSPISLQAVRYVSVATEATPTISYETAFEVIQSASSTPFRITIPDKILIGTTTATTTAHTEE